LCSPQGRLLTRTLRSCDREGWRSVYAARHRRAACGVAWERYAWGGERRLRGHSEFVTALAECGGAIYSGSLDGTIRQWDRNTLAHVRSLQEPAGRGRRPARIWCLVERQGELVSGHGDGALRVWDVATGRCRARLWGHSGEVNTVAVCGDRLVRCGALPMRKGATEPGKLLECENGGFRTRAVRARPCERRLAIGAAHRLSDVLLSDPGQQVSRRAVRTAA
jgi:WD40 repeat protein